MVKLTIIGRLRDRLPLAQVPRYQNEENESFSYYKHQGEFILKEISRGALSLSRMTIRLDHHSFDCSLILKSFNKKNDEVQTTFSSVVQKYLRELQLTLSLFPLQYGAPLVLRRLL
ncbi:hypothetical protein SLEP1_g3484 [Rubroshorea leprosula]|uniref:Uncharacterized protein n=1 Tax=Rubroshorea leprosula TaxID=152421 RepID=A0AAV5HKM6_9ROSI|nr:hypothetical protein SLEP1_g3484 [Rubroshorea leprosula]